MAAQLVFSIFALVLLAAFILGLLGANPNAGFASMIFGWTETLMKPFVGIFDPIVLTEGTEIRTSLIFGIVVYAAIAGVIGAVANRLGRP